MGKNCFITFGDKTINILSEFTQLRAMLFVQEIFTSINPTRGMHFAEKIVFRNVQHFTKTRDIFQNYAIFERFMRFFLIWLKLKRRKKMLEIVKKAFLIVLFWKALF